MRNMKMKYKIAPFIILLLIGVSSCLDDNGRSDFSKVGNVIEMLDAKAGVSTALNTSDDDGDGVLDDIVIPVRINQAGPDATNEDIEVTLGINQSGLDLYNRNTEHVIGTMVPAEAISFPATVTIKAGLDEYGNKNRTAIAELVIHPSKIPATAGMNYVVSFGILSASSDVTVSGNFGAILYNFYHNQYDGWYKVTGPLTDVAAPTITQYPGLEFQMVTINATTCSIYTNQVSAGNYHPILSSGSGSIYGAVGIIIEFNADNTVKSVKNAYVDTTAGRNRTLKLDPTGVNKYDPATKTLKVKYIMHQDDIGDRTTFDETWVYEHP